MLSSRSRRSAGLFACFSCVAILAGGVAFAAPGDITASLAVDINQAPSPPSSDSKPASMINVGGTLFFSALDPDHGRELWMSDGTAAGTARLTDIRPGPQDALATGHPFVAVGNTVLFSAFDGTNADLYKVDPPYTNGPTKIQINPTGSSSPGDAIVFAGDA